MLNKILDQIPGHVRAHTWLEALIAGAAAYVATKRLVAAIGMIIVVIGAYLGNQATHLDQENHSGMAITWIERQQQNHKNAFQFIGLLLVAIGIWIAWTPLLH